MATPIRVLIVDDSATVRKLLSDALASAPDIEVVGTAPDPYVARDKIVALRPDVLTLDIEMPRMDGLTFLKVLMEKHPMPVLMISSLGQASCQATFEAFRLGAIDVLAKPDGPYSVGELASTLAMKIRAAATARVRKQLPEASAQAPLASARSSVGPTSSSTRIPNYARGAQVIAIGASTGGPQALSSLLAQLPAEMPPILITQHMPPVFTAQFADRLNRNSNLSVKEAMDGDEVLPGQALVAPGDLHMTLVSVGGSLRVRVASGPQVCFSRPSVDVLFFSVAKIIGRKAVGMLLTGMGQDGAQGLLKMRDAGAKTFAQDESSCVVFGMPREAIRLGAAQIVAPLERLSAALLRELEVPATKG